jgi:transcriptional regulator with XRE-family HTH domain
VTARKTDAERGPLGAWAYRTRDLLDLTVEVVAERIAASPATLRKIEGGSNTKPSARMLRDLYAVYLRAAEDRPRPIAIEPPPGMSPEAPSASVGLDALVTVFARQAEALEEQNTVMREQLAEMRRQNAILASIALGNDGEAEERMLAIVRDYLSGDASSRLPGPKPDPRRTPAR